VNYEPWIRETHGWSVEIGSILGEVRPAVVRESNCGIPHQKLALFQRLTCGGGSKVSNLSCSSTAWAVPILAPLALISPFRYCQDAQERVGFRFRPICYKDSKARLIRPRAAAYAPLLALQPAPPHLRILIVSGSTAARRREAQGWPGLVISWCSTRACRQAGAPPDCSLAWTHEQI